MSALDHKARARVLETRAIYRKADEAFAPYSCPASGECCQLATTKREPWVLQSEWETLTAHLSASKRALPEDRTDGGCPFLDAAGKRCTVYEARPFGCRTFFCSRIRGPAKQPVDVVDALLRRLVALNDGAAQGDEVEDDSRNPQPVTRNPSPAESGGPLDEWIRVSRASNSRPR